MVPNVAMLGMPLRGDLFTSLRKTNYFFLELSLDMTLKTGMVMAEEVAAK